MSESTGAGSAEIISQVDGEFSEMSDKKAATLKVETSSNRTPEAATLVDKEADDKAGIEAKTQTERNTKRKNANKENAGVEQANSKDGAPSEPSTGKKAAVNEATPNANAAKRARRRQKIKGRLQDSSDSDSKIDLSPAGLAEGSDGAKAENSMGGLPGEAKEEPKELVSNLGATLIPQHKYFDALARAVAAGGSNKELSKNSMKKLLKYLGDSDIADHKPEDKDSGPTKRARKAMTNLRSIMERAELTPVDVPFCMKKKKTKHALPFFLDGLTFGSTNQPFGGSVTETVLQYAERLDLPSKKFLMDWYAQPPEPPPSK